MNLLRRMSTVRLLALVGAIVAVVLVAGIAVARDRGNPKPPPSALAPAVHKALAAGPVQGISARITFTNHLFPTGAISAGSGSALLNGGTGRLWLSRDGRFRLELQSDAGDTQVMGDGQSLRLYDASRNLEYVLPLRHEHPHRSAPPTKEQTDFSVAAIRSALKQVAGAANITGAIPGDIAGRPVYSVRISPKHDGGLLGGLQLAWDAQHGVPLKVAIYSRGDSSPVLALTASDVHYGPVSGSDLTVHPPSSTTITHVTLPTAPAHKEHGKHEHVTVSGVAAVAKQLPFRLSAPSTLVGLPRQSVRLVDAGNERAALVVYGKGLGAIVVLQQRVAGGSDPLAGLPQVSINGASGRELATALGTVLRFQRGGVTYTLLGSVPPVAAEAAARGLS